MRTERRCFLADLGAMLGAGLVAGRPVIAADDGPVLDTLARLKRDMDDAPLAMRFRGTTAEECRAWQIQFGKKLRDLLGSFAPPAKWQTTVQKTTDLEDHRREELLLTAEGYPPLPVYLLLPRPKAAKRRGGILALHGHGKHGHHAVAGRDDLAGVGAAIKSANYDYGRQLARRGYAVAVPCFTPFGVRAGDRELFGRPIPVPTPSSGCNSSASC
jgi:hypothetical protein